MIHALCLNPAVDKLYRIDGFRPGETYSALEPERFAGGKGVNLARVLSQLGGGVRLYAFLGETGGEAIRREMEARCPCAFIELPGACRTTVNVVDRASGMETVLTERGPRADARHLQALFDALEANVRPGDLVCCSGSIAAGAPDDVYAQVSRLCTARGANCALDCNAAQIGPSLRGAHYALGKPNAAELCDHLRAMRTKEPKEIARLARKLMPPFDALLVSLGADGGVLARRDGKALLARVPEIEIRSSVGSGDACFAGAALAISRGLPDGELLRLAMACGAANAIEGPPGSVQRETVETLYKQIKIESL